VNVDYQTIINIFVGAGLSVLGWFARRIWDALDGLKGDLSKLREELPKTYITKDDFREGVKELKSLLLAIDAKLDRKVDK
jgi:hypothetical protein